jgi:hypothetical protein
VNQGTNIMSNENNSPKISRALAEGSIKAMAYHITITYLIPFGAPAITFLIGYCSGLPWFWIWLGALAAFAFISNGLLRFNEWLYMCRAQDKLMLESVIVGRSISDEGVFIGLRFCSVATFPIEFQVTNIRTQIGDKVPIKPHLPGKKYTVPPKGCGWYNDNVIQVTNPPRPGTVEGHIEYTINYGKPGCLKYAISGKKQIVASFNDDGLLVTAIWNDAI